MKKLLVLFALLPWLLTALPTTAQTPVFCPTRPPGDNTNACASTAFVIANAGGGGGGGITTVTPAAPVTASIVGSNLNVGFAVGTAGYALLGNGASAPTFQGFTAPETGATTRTIPDKLRDLLYAQDFGAVGDGTTDDSTKITAALNACNSRGGGYVYLKPTGHAYLINTGVTLGNGCKLLGAGTKVYPGSTATVAQWTQAGSWIQCADATNPCVTAANSGSGVEGINFIHTQVVPSGGSWTPTTWPYTIKVTGTMFTLKNIVSVGDSHGIQVLYPAANGGGTYSVIEDVYFSGYSICAYIDAVNDVLRVTNAHCRNLYYESDSRVYTYMINNSIGMDIHYWDNPFIDGFECLLVNQCMQFTDNTVLGETHSFWNAQVVNLQCNLVPGCAKVTANTTHVQATFTNALVQSEDTLIGTANPYAFDFTTNNVFVVFDALTISDVGRGVLTLGNAGAGAVAQINNLVVRQYSGLTAGNVAFNVTANAKLFIPSGSLNITGSSSPAAGAVFAGAGSIFTLPDPTATLNGGVKAVTCGAGQFVNVVAATPTCGTPAGGGTVTATAGALTANQVVIGNGGTDLKTLGSLGTISTVLHGNAAGAPSFGAVVSADLNITTTTCTNQFITAISANGTGTCTTNVLAGAQHANQGTTTTLLHGNAAGNPSFGAVVSADMNITTTTCTNQFVTAIGAGGVGTCTTDTLASAQHANQGATTQVLHGNAAGNPSWSSVAISTDVSGLGTGVGTFLGTPSSANLAAALTDEVGTGNAIFGIGSTAWPSNPTISVGGCTTGITYSSQTGRYVRVGNFIYAIFDIRLTNKGTCAPGNLAINNLPVAIGSAINAQGTVTFYQNMASITGPLTLSGSVSGSTIDFVSIGGASSIAQATDSNLTNTTIMVGWLGYFN